MKLLIHIIFLQILLLSCTSNNIKNEISSQNEFKYINYNFQTFDKYERPEFENQIKRIDTSKIYYIVLKDQNNLIKYSLKYFKKPKNIKNYKSIRIKFKYTKKWFKGSVKYLENLTGTGDATQLMILAVIIPATALTLSFTYDLFLNTIKITPIIAKKIINNIKKNDDILMEIAKYEYDKKNRLILYEVYAPSKKRTVLGRVEYFYINDMEYPVKSIKRVKSRKQKYLY